MGGGLLGNPFTKYHESMRDPASHEHTFHHGHVGLQNLCVFLVVLRSMFDFLILL